MCIYHYKCICVLPICYCYFCAIRFSYVYVSNGPTRNLMRTKNPKPYNLLGLVGWWRRHEKLEEAFLRSPSTSRKPPIPSITTFFTQCTGSLTDTENIMNITGVTELKKTSPMKKQKSNFSATLQFWAGKQSSTEQQHVSLSPEAATNP